MGFGKKWIHMVHGVSSDFFSVLVNRSVAGFFRSARGPTNAVIGIKYFKWFLSAVLSQFL